MSEAQKDSKSVKAGPGRPSTKPEPPTYTVEVLAKALDVLDTLRSAGAELRLSEIARSARLDVSTAFRLLRTFEQRGYILREAQTRKYRLCLGYRSYRIGYAQLSSDQPFSRKVTQGLLDAAARHRVELIVADNHLDPGKAIENARWLLTQNIDFMIEYNFHYRAAPVLASMFAKARIPTLAIDIPQPEAIYFGVNNYEVGRMGGEALAGFAQRAWDGRIDRILLLELTAAGRVPQSRVLGTLAGLEQRLPGFDSRCVIHRNSKGDESGGYAATQRVLRSLGRRERLLIAAANDSSARGAIRAVREKQREKCTAILAQGWGPDPALDEELHAEGTPLIGAVAYFPENYGTAILPVILRYLNGQRVPPSVHTAHALVTNQVFKRGPSETT
jgi:ribose transport system substrate-binding protein